MKQPKGFIAVEYGPDGNTLVCRLRKAVYVWTEADATQLAPCSPRLHDDTTLTVDNYFGQIDPGSYVYRSSDVTIVAINAIYIYIYIC